MPHPNLRSVVRFSGTVAIALTLATAVVAALENRLDIPNASAVYLVAVVVTALVSGTKGAIVSSIASFLLYDFLFVEPRFTFTIRDPQEYLAVVLLLFVGIVVGQLAALERARTADARAREREARALFRLSRSLATRQSTSTALVEIARVLADEANLSRVLIAAGEDDAREIVVADTSNQLRLGIPTSYWILRRTEGDRPAEWVRVYGPSVRPRSGSREGSYRVRMETPGRRLGSIWAFKEKSSAPPDRTETRLLSAAADQVALALAHDQLEAESQSAEIARQSDELKSALLQSVSHDLRTPLATIRAAAGSLKRSGGLTEAERDESADAIDREVEYLNRMVTNLLDLSRIEAGALHAERDVFELDDLVNQSLMRLRPRLALHPLEISLDAPPVVVDPVFLDSAVTNVLENALKYTPADARLAISARLADGAVTLTIEDGGPGVPPDALDKLFDKFYRVPQMRHNSRSGTGIGLAVARGLIETMGGTVTARASALGGLAIDIKLELAPIPAAERDAVPVVLARSQATT